VSAATGGATETTAAGGAIASPYPGPRPFKADDHSYFHGRTREVRDVLTLLAGYRLMLLYAQSGVGKSSLVTAGIAPRLADTRGRRGMPATDDESDEPEPPIPLKLTGIRVLTARVSGVHSSDHPTGADAVNIYVHNVLTTIGASASPAPGPEPGPEPGAQPGRGGGVTLATRLPGLSASQSAAVVAAAAGAANRAANADVDDGERIEPIGEPLLLVLDQFEEIFTAYPDRWQEREAFFAQLGDALAARPRLRVLIVMREEYLALVERFATFLPDGFRVRYRLDRLREQDAEDAVTRPAKQAVRAAIRAAGGNADAPIVARTRRAAEAMSARAADLVHELQKVPLLGRQGEVTAIEGEFVEPLHLQIVCRTLWEQDTGAAPATSLSTVGAGLDVDQVLAGFYQQALRQASASRATWIEAAVSTLRRMSQYFGLAGLLFRRLLGLLHIAPDLHAWVAYHLITPMGTRSQVYLDVESKRVAGLPVRYVDALEHEHIVRRDSRAGAAWYELTHDRFIFAIQTIERRRQEQFRRVASVGTAAALLLLAVVVMIYLLQTRSKQQVTAEQIQRADNVLSQQQRSADAARVKVDQGFALLRGNDPQGQELLRQGILENATAGLAAIKTEAWKETEPVSFARAACIRVLVPYLQRDGGDPGLRKYACQFPAHVIGASAREDRAAQELTRFQSGGFPNAELSEPIAGLRKIYVGQFVSCDAAAELIRSVDRDFQTNAFVENPLEGLCGGCPTLPQSVAHTSVSLTTQTVTAAADALRTFKIGIYYLKTNDDQARRAKELVTSLQANGFKGTTQIYPVTQQTMQLVLPPTDDQVRFDYGEESQSDALMTLLRSADPTGTYKKLLTGSGTRNFLSIFFKP
jgi:hypothetical protein